MASSSLLLVCLLPMGCMAVSSEAFVKVNMTFPQYMAAHGKTYVKESAEYVEREGLFNQRVAEVLAHNAAGHSWEMELNTFSDWTEAELLSLRGYKRRHVGDSTPSSVLQRDSRGDVEPANQPAGATESMDWSASLATSKDVMNQGPCGSCWAVAATAAVQLHAAKAYPCVAGKPCFNKRLSPENINKCTPNPQSCGGEGGCQGSTPELAFKYLVSLGSSGGLYPEDTLPYTAVTGQKIPADDCAWKMPGAVSPHFRAKPVQPAVSIADWKQVPTNNAQEVMNALVNEGPLAVAVVGAGIQGYRKGIISKCKSTVVDHATVLMGFGKDPEKNMMYWKIRNSWGTNWGEDGFFRLKRNYGPTSSIMGGTSALQGAADEPCAWDNDPAKGVACKDDKGEYPKQTWVCGECGIISDVAYPKGVTVHKDLLSVM